MYYIDMPFRYRLQKILEFRIRKKEEQEAVVQKAQQAVHQAEMDIEQNNNEIKQTIMAKRMADYRMMEYYDKYLHHLWDKAEELEKKRQELQEVLDQEMQKLIKCEQEVKVLENHKEKKKEQYIAEEKAAELKMFSELGVQRHFLRSREQAIEQEAIEEMYNNQENEQ